ncbi:MAG: PIN domain-containing protein [Acidobacteriota bacterium]|nr:PIN domain-containing protein [Acidobacteriota bacterium]
MNDWLFLDTSGLLCIHDQDDFRNAQAIEIFTAARFLLTSNYVLAEFVPLSQTRGKDRQETISFINDLLEIPRLELIWVDENLHNQAMELLANRLDKNYSLCDAVSFVLMRERGIIEALTTDKHFEQEGFIKLLSS